jgi:hypothetical protein
MSSGVSCGDADSIFTGSTTNQKLAKLPVFDLDKFRPSDRQILKTKAYFNSIEATDFKIRVLDITYTSTIISLASSDLKDQSCLLNTPD